MFNIQNHAISFLSVHIQVHVQVEVQDQEA